MARFLSASDVFFNIIGLEKIVQICILMSLQTQSISLLLVKACVHSNQAYSIDF